MSTRICGEADPAIALISYRAQQKINFKPHISAVTPLQAFPA